MATTVKERHVNPDITERPLKSHRSGASGLDASKQIIEPKRARIKRLRPGDLAIVVKDDSDQLNLGVIVRILSSSGFRWWSQWDAKRKTWGASRSLKSSYVEALSTRGLSYHRNDCHGDLVVHRFGTIPTSYLRRINQ